MKKKTNSKLKKKRQRKKLKLNVVKKNIDKIDVVTKIREVCKFEKRQNYVKFNFEESKL